MENSSLTVNGSTFYNNEAKYGGGIANFGTANVTTSTFEENDASTYDPDEVGGGGAIANIGTITIADTTIWRNRSSKGGGVHNHSAMKILRSTIAENEGEWGGGIWNLGTLEVANTTLTGNFAYFKGGGIVNKRNLTLLNSTIAKNETKGKGGNIYTGAGTHALLLARNTIFANGLPQNCVGPVTGQVGNVRSPKTDLSCVGAFGNPKLGELQDNGGPTWTMALGAGSAAIDFGKYQVCSATPIDGIDQRGVTRSAPCDSGAYESEE